MNFSIAPLLAFWHLGLPQGWNFDHVKIPNCQNSPGKPALPQPPSKCSSMYLPQGGRGKVITGRRDFSYLPHIKRPLCTCTCKNIFFPKGICWNKAFGQRKSHIPTSDESNFEIFRTFVCRNFRHFRYEREEALGTRLEPVHKQLPAVNSRWRLLRIWRLALLGEETWLWPSQRDLFPLRLLRKRTFSPVLAQKKPWKFGR